MFATTAEARIFVGQQVTARRQKENFVADQFLKYFRTLVVVGRKHKGYNPESFGEKVGMTGQAIRYFESGKTRLPREENWKKMLEALGLTPEAVMTAYLRGDSAEKLALSLEVEQGHLF